MKQVRDIAMEETPFIFTEDSGDNPTDYDASDWLVMSVEDDIGYQQSLRLSLQDFLVKDKKIRFMSANSAATAADIISRNDDIAIILLDVVMERDDAGLFLVNTIRNVIGNSRVRIVLLTGQPGMAPRQDTMQQYDIDEYWNKVDLTEEKLRSLITGNIRTWESLNELYIAKRGLQMIVDASRSITSKQNVTDFTKTVLQEVSRVIGIPESGGIVCAYRPQQATVDNCPIVASSGEFLQSKSESLCDLIYERNNHADNALSYSVEKALKEREHQFEDGWSVLYFDTETLDNQSYLIIVRSPKELKSSHITLLMVFSENIGNGFVNLALLNRLSTLAYYDNDLNIPNRNWVHKELVSMNAMDRQDTVMAIFHMLDFSSSEIVLGAEYTKATLEALVESFRRKFPRAYAIVRLSDETLAVLFHKNHAPSERHLRRLIEQTLNIGNVLNKLHLAIGVLKLSILTADSSEKALRIAELALLAQNEKGERFCIMTAQMLSEVEARFSMLRELQDAITTGRNLELVFQPKINLKTDELLGVEALLRWKSDDGCNIPPSEFIALAETSGLINQLDTLVVEKSIAAASVLMKRNILCPVAFNLTCSDIETPLFIDTLRGTMDKFNVPADMLEIEITESQAVEDYDKLNPILQQVIEMGIKVSIDDFGTGYSSLAHLTRLAATNLKVDQSFIAALESNDSDSAELVIDMVFKLAEQFNFGLIAEGIETDNQRRRMLAKGYVCGQGFLFSKPLQLDALINWAENKVS